MAAMTEELWAVLKAILRADLMENKKVGAMGEKAVFGTVHDMVALLVA